jgi:hypothetical protein
MIPLLKKASVAALAVAGLVVGASSARAGSLALGTSGWTASWDNGLDSRLSLVVDGESADSVFIEKFATFTTDDVNSAGGLSGLVIVFQKTSVNAKPFIVIDNEAIVNNTGVDWTDFHFIIQPPTGQVAFDTGKTDVSPPGSGFSIDPFTNATYSNNDTVLTVDGGTVSSTIPNNTWFPGAASGELVINTAAGQPYLSTFFFKELPSADGRIIPLPAAAWSGLSGLLGLALVSSRKHLRKLF